ncbi:type II toxin-antitoxin system PemK/MazF family toxin [Leucobacter viscericola]|uniref:Type II toxin-antitoxin system PemK/MazF family toxin n=1 Tax=Leucobacter viscericola TaxID=2714935 RepID=A0A6G7XGW3_9MICO|nr:type II toxin-antitoxin system PemK/MazF family toxin [Leucobacter viscericola]QIK63611.1 type II toxin-antitoxin system PemK/MazF family toxin [Leucobacter viscericola]
MDLIRGRVYMADLESGELKPWVVVSNNNRNRSLGSALAVRVTTTNRFAELPSVVALPDGECVSGWVRCDSLTTLYADEPTKALLGLSRPAMALIEDGIKAALGMG